MKNSRNPFVVPIFLPHAGCPHRCVFCNQHAVTGATTLPTISEFNSAISRFLGYATGRPSEIQIAFYGGNFLGLPDPEVISLLTLAQQFVRDGRADSIRFSTRPDTIDERRLKLISGYSVRTIELGVQSMDLTVLTQSRRGHTSGQTVAAVQRLKREDYMIGLQMMIGLPGDTIERSDDTARRIIDLLPNFVRIYPAVVLENSLLAEWYRQGRFTPWPLDTCVNLVKDLYLLFKQYDIAVIRMGLQAEKDFNNAKSILAGPYHPAFGHLVHSKVYLDAAIAALKSTKHGKDNIRIYVHPRSISKMHGHKNHNIITLQSKFQLRKVQVLPDPSLDEDSIRLDASDCLDVNDLRSPEQNIVTAVASD